jgi:hypothetical protein
VHKELRDLYLLDGFKMAYYDNKANGMQKYKLPLAELVKLKVPNHRDVGSIPVEHTFFFLNV